MANSNPIKYNGCNAIFLHDAFLRPTYPILVLSLDHIVSLKQLLSSYKL